METTKTIQYTVKDMARLAGVSVRTLHHYDQIGLLVPAHAGSNGYRYYGALELERLRQIVAHRALGMPLRAIAALLDKEGTSRIARLEKQRRDLLAEAERCQRMAAEIEVSIIQLTGDQHMKHEDLYRTPTAKERQRHRREAVARFGEEAVARSEAALQETPPDAQAEHMAELARIEAGLAACCRDGTPFDDAGLDALLTRHRAWVSRMWGRACTPEAYAGLAGMYEGTLGFRDRYETLAAGFADYLPAAMRAYAARASASGESAG